MKKGMKEFFESKSISPSRLKTLDKGYKAYLTYVNRKKIFVSRGGAIGSYVDAKLTEDDSFVMELFKDAKIDEKSKIFKTMEYIIIKDKIKTLKDMTLFKDRLLATSQVFAVDRRIKDTDKRWKLFTDKENWWDILILNSQNTKVLDDEMLDEAKDAIAKIKENVIYQKFINEASKIEYQKTFDVFSSKFNVNIKGMTDIIIHKNDTIINIDLKYTHDLDMYKDAYYRMKYGVPESMYRNAIIETVNKDLEDYESINDSNVRSIFLFYNQHGVEWLEVSPNRMEHNDKWVSSLIKKYVNFREEGFNIKRVYGKTIDVI